MLKVTRRAALQTPFPLAAAITRPLTPGTPRLQLSEVFAPGQTKRFRLFRQAGVHYAIATVTGDLAKVRREDYLPTLTRIQSDFRDQGFTIVGVESHPVPAEKIKLGVAGRDEEIENYKAAIDALARIGVRMICYNFMAGLGWYRTKNNIAERGGALVSEFDLKDAQAQGPTRWGEVSEEKMWENMAYFQKAVIPHAEKAGVMMALHPDDPPTSPLRGIARILTSAKNYRRVMDMVPSPINGVTYCQANFKAMGENIEDLAKEWLREKKIFFVHYRDIAGNIEHFHETFHDNGPTDMARILKIYGDYGFNGPIRPDHAPTMDGDPTDTPGYTLIGKTFAFGYMKGIMDSLGINYE